MNDTLRYIIAGILIFFIILLQPIYLKWLGYDSNPIVTEEILPSINNIIEKNLIEKNISLQSTAINEQIVSSTIPESFITVITPLYTATVSNKSGGSFTNYIINSNNEERKYIGGYNDFGIFNPNIPVSMILPSLNDCYPCLATYDSESEKYTFINTIFSHINKSAYSDTIFLDYDDSIDLQYSLIGDDGDILIDKLLSFSGSNYISKHIFTIKKNFQNTSNLELIWYGGLRPTEKMYNEDIQYGSGIISQAGEIEDVQTTDPEKNIHRTIYNGDTEWAALRTKYFMTALIVSNPGIFATLSSSSTVFGDQQQFTPAYNASIGYPHNIKTISSRLYIGPLDIDYISETNTNLDETMNWGYSIIRPISKSILWVLKFMHNALKLNYGLVLLLFALLIRLITGPLTKKSYESTQNMQKIQPQIKIIQKKYKNDPQRLNKETMKLYKTHKVNPLGGCLPILLQMPLLWALFIVFRTTIEFRGAPFIFWISDLSKPDVVFQLPFTIPIYGSGVAILPLIMGGTLMLTMSMSSSTMDKSQKPIMYIMNGFFILLFNTFPSGLNLYYTTYNFLSYLQQRSIKKIVNK